MSVRKFVRHVISLGKSLAITLPAEYVRTYNINKGDTIRLTCDKSIFIGVPMKERAKAEEITKKMQEVES